MAVGDGAGNRAPVARRGRTGRDAATAPPEDPQTVRALAYPQLVGDPVAGDRVLLNASALRAGPGHRRVRPGGGPAGPAAAGRGRHPVTWSRPGTPRCRPIVLGVDEEASPHRDAARRAPTTWPACRWSPPTCTRRCRRSSPGSAPTRPDGPGRVRDDRRRCAAGLVLPHPRRAARPTGRRGHRRAGVRRRPGGDQRAQRAARRPARARAPTWRSSRRARATSAPAPGGASPASPSARRSTRSPRWAGGRSARCGSPTPTRGPRHRGVSHHSLTAYGRVALAAGGPGGARRPAAGARGRGRRRRWRRWPTGTGWCRVRSRRSGRGAAGRCRCRLSTMGRASTPTAPTSSPPRPPAATPPRCPARARRPETRLTRDGDPTSDGSDRRGLTERVRPGRSATEHSDAGDHGEPARRPAPRSARCTRPAGCARSRRDLLAPASIQLRPRRRVEPDRSHRHGPAGVRRSTACRPPRRRVTCWRSSRSTRSS